MNRKAICVGVLVTLSLMGPAQSAAGQSAPAVAQEKTNPDELQQKAADATAQAPAAPIQSGPKFSWVNAGTAAGSMRPRQGNYVQILLTRGDALEGTTAITCTQNNGARIRLSGGFRPSHALSMNCR